MKFADDAKQVTCDDDYAHDEIGDTVNQKMMMTMNTASKNDYS